MDRLYSFAAGEEMTRYALKYQLGGSVEKFVSIDFGGYAHPAVVGGLDAHDLPVAADVHIARAGNLFRESENKVYRAADFELRFGKKIQTAVTDIASLSLKFRRMRV
jgi:hypothetical protein